MPSIDDRIRAIRAKAVRKFLAVDRPRIMLAILRYPTLPQILSRGRAQAYTAASIGVPAHERARVLETADELEKMTFANDDDSQVLRNIALYWAEHFRIEHEIGCLLAEEVEKAWA